MSIQFGPQYGFPSLLDSTGDRIAPCERKWPSGWWILPATIVGFVECVGLIGWIVA